MPLGTAKTIPLAGTGVSISQTYPAVLRSDLLQTGQAVGEPLEVSGLVAFADAAIRVQAHGRRFTLPRVPLRTTKVMGHAITQPLLIQPGHPGFQGNGADPLRKAILNTRLTTLLASAHPPRGLEKNMPFRTDKTMQLVPAQPRTFQAPQLLSVSGGTQGFGLIEYRVFGR